MNECIFCKIIKGDIPAKKIAEDENFIAIYDISPKAPVHVLVLPKKHIPSLINLKSADKDLMGSLMFQVKTIAAKLDLDKSGYKVVINNGEGSGQFVFHLHLHLLGGWAGKMKGWQV